MTQKNLKQRFISTSKSVVAQENFEELFNKLKKNEPIKVGTVVKGKVVDIDDEVVIVDIKLKNEGKIPLSEFKLASDVPLPQIGDLVDVYVEKLEGRNGRTVLSREKALREEAWSILEESQKNGSLVDGVIFGKVKGGFTVDLSGVVAFLPGSQVDVRRPIKNIAPLMNIVQPFQILKMDKKLGNIVVSRRAVLEEARSGIRQEVLSKIHVGMILNGVVKSIVYYGAFVELSGSDELTFDIKVDGLLHSINILWRKINHPGEELQVGQQVRVVVIGIDISSGQISLGMKQLSPNPWDDIDKNIQIDDIKVGKVKSIAEYGVFIEVTKDLEGLCHSGHLSWDKINQNPKKSLTIGQEVIFKILDIDKERHRISLSLKLCKPNPWQVLVKEFPVGTIVKAPLRNITNFGMFVALSVTTDAVKYDIDGKEYEVSETTYQIDGMIHESDIPRYGDLNNSPLKNYNKGEEIECMVLAVDMEKERINLGIKQLISSSK
ncbi:S1 RNA binding domain protein [Orientia chuto str. Dubai]|uniref:Small ribosomal subunit protein bS1 n=1 Tax=Orientia chuto str. Dubai TaxID=1359168 RepID=A0A0F3ML78_9RICK|nr:S1 RNA-binding domain-containing protein [Candidatus Orientia mediorientalis]KJV56538.1 S1 RNA binding domain protein [Orientia chuto str. Dubai]